MSSIFGTKPAPATAVREEAGHVQLVTNDLNSFMAEVHTAAGKPMEERFVEADPEIIKQVVGGYTTGYVWFKNVKVYPTGKKQELDAMDSQDSEKKLFGK